MAYLIVMAGLPGTGKSFTARKLCDRLGDMHLINQNDLRRQDGWTHYKKFTQGKDFQESILKKVDRKVLKSLLNHDSVIVDAAHRFRSRRHELYGIASGCNARVLTLETVCDESCAKSRIRSRPSGDGKVVDGYHTRVYDKVAAHWENVSGDYVFASIPHVSYVTYDTKNNIVGRKIEGSKAKTFIDRVERVLLR